MSAILTGATRKTVRSIRPAPGRHWVGDGFPVHGMFGYSGAEVAARSPFLLLDYAAPMEFAPATRRRGVGSHPHRGFETVTIVFEGEVEHRDSTGAGGVIGPGDVQWMTAGAGIVHEEFHTGAWTRRGGIFHVAQLWVNLPARDKMTAPKYQPITRAGIPLVTLPDGAGRVRVIAGSFGAAQGPACTFTPMNVLDAYLNAGRRVEFTQPEGWNTLVVMLDGSVRIDDEHTVAGPSVVTLSDQGAGLELAADTDAHVLVLAGEPIDEPVFGYGPFVMNDRTGIEQAIEDFNRGLFGQIDAHVNARADGRVDGHAG